MENIGHYEMMVMLMPDLGEAGTKKELDIVRELIAEHGGKITSEDLWGHRELAYRIKKQDTAYYAVLNFTLPPAQLQELNQPLNINQAVMRYLVSKVPADYQMVTLNEYQEIADKEEAERAAEREKLEAEKEELKKKRKERLAKKAEEEEREAKAKKAAKSEEKAPKKESKKETSQEAEKPKKDAKKLDDIVDNPDISL